MVRWSGQVAQTQKICTKLILIGAREGPSIATHPHVHLHCYACPHMCVPFHCSIWLHCVSFPSHSSNHSGPTCTSALKCGPRARILTSSRQFTQNHVCATFCHCYKVCILRDIHSEQLPGIIS